MKILLISIGSIKDQSLRQLQQRYAARLPFYMPFEHISLPDVKVPRNAGADIIKQREGEAILARVQSGDFLVLMDERGKELSSRDLADFISRKSAALARNLVFVIGGPYGFSQAVYDRADMLLAISKMTFTHEMACVITTEQLYRAQTIIRGEPYHHD